MKGRRAVRAPIVVLVLVAAAVGATATGAWAGKPDMQRFDVDVTEPDTFMSAECGVAVTARVRGHVIVRAFDRERGVVELTTLNLAVTLTANGNSYSFRDVGADQVRLTKDGAILSIIGQIPIEGWHGVLKINLDTDEIVHEPSPNHFVGIAEVCAALTA